MCGPVLAEYLPACRRTRVSEGTRTPDRRDHNPTKPVVLGQIRLSEPIRAPLSCSDLRSKLSPRLTPSVTIFARGRAVRKSCPQPANHSQPVPEEDPRLVH
jgi:hypothetical protein